MCWMLSEWGPTSTCLWKTIGLTPVNYMSVLGNNYHTNCAMPYSILNDKLNSGIRFTVINNELNDISSW